MAPPRTKTVATAKKTQKKKLPNCSSNGSSTFGNSESTPPSGLNDLKTPIAICIGSSGATIALPPSTPGLRGEIIADKHGERHIPATVAFVDDLEVGIDLNSGKYHHISGTDAHSQKLRNLSRTVCGFFPLIGLPFSHKKVQEASRWSHVAIQEPESGNPLEAAVYMIPLPAKKTDGVSLKTSYTAANLTELLLKSLKLSAESHCGAIVTKCVLTYPQEFSVQQIIALREASLAAGLFPVSMMSEPSAVALANDYEAHISQTEEIISKLNKPSIKLIVDVGSSVARLCLFNISASIFTLISYTVCENLGAKILDTILASHFAGEHERKSGSNLFVLNSEENICPNNVLVEAASSGVRPAIYAPRSTDSCSAKNFAQMLTAAEESRKILSTRQTASCYIEAIGNSGADFVSNITQQRFGLLAKSWRHELESELNNFIASAAIDPMEINSVIFCGGASRMPIVRQVFEEQLEGVGFDSAVEADEAIALGAALHSMQIPQYWVPSSSDESDQLDSLNVPHLQYPLGIMDEEGCFRELIPRYTQLPFNAKVTIKLPNTQAEKKQPILVRIAEGREKIPEDDETEYVGSFYPLFYGSIISELSVVCEKKGKPASVEVTFNVAEDLTASYKVTLLDNNGIEMASTTASN